jgi:3-hydroxyacyl-CoA dehydrogenase
MGDSVEANHHNMKVEDIERVGVVGAGLMGHGIAFAFALGGYPTIVGDLSEEALRKAMTNVKATAKLFAEEGLITGEEADDAVGRTTTTLDLAELAASSDFITEAIVERSQDKRDLFNRLDGLAPPHTIIVSNTSSMVLSDFASDVKRQDKIAVTHYFAPPAIVPGVEVAGGTGTSDETYNTTYELMKKINHVPIRVLKELPGYLLNRVQSAMGREALRLWAEGVATAEEIELGIRTTFGFRMPHEGPMMHYDLSGNWRQPKDVQRRTSAARILRNPEPDGEAAERIRLRLAEGTPWFIRPEDFDEVSAARDREYVRRLKELYWRKG